MQNKEIDIVIPVHKKDLSILEYCISQARKKISGVRRIIIVSKEKYSNNAEWFDEALFPFSYKEIAELTSNLHVGWNYQQLLKLYSPLVIPGILENVLVLDSDTVFFRKTEMIDGGGRLLYNISKDKNIERSPFDIKVEEHIKKLFPAISRENLPSELSGFSAICHHMLFNRKIIEELFKKVEDFHFQKSGVREPFYRLAMMDSKKEMVFAEYQTYFNYVAIFHSDKIATRKIKYKNTADQNIRKYRFRLKYHYCSFHHYLRGTKTKCWRAKTSNYLSRIYKKLFLLECWNIGVARCNIANFLTIPNQEIHWLKPLKFRADPFGLIDSKGKKQIFFEYYDTLKRKGEIRRIEIEDDFKITEDDLVLRKPHHLSYPYIFTDKETTYALVESYKSRGLTLYRVDEENHFVEIKKILKDIEVVDPSIVKFNNKWWLFFNLANRGDEELYIAYAYDLEGQWTMHKNNPVKSDLESSRCGGEIFYHQNSLYRPAQNCSNSYGGSITINKINELSEENFSESHEIQVTPNQFGPYPTGLHTISKLGDSLTLVDGRRYSFSPNKPLIGLVRLFIKVFKK